MDRNLLLVAAIPLQITTTFMSIRVVKSKNVTKVMRIYPYGIGAMHCNLSKFRLEFHSEC